MQTIIYQEQYGEYDLTVYQDVLDGYLVGSISSTHDVEVPLVSIRRLHGGSAEWTGTDFTRSIFEIPETEWIYIFRCGQDGDISIVNGIEYHDLSDPIPRREWTPLQVINHIKECLVAWSKRS